MKLILASQSPRRREILENLGLSFRVVTQDTDESCGEIDPEAYVCEVALRKARAVVSLLRERGEFTPDTLVIASDTVVASEGQILGKPHSKEQARDMLTLLSGKSHKVISGVALVSGEKTMAEAESTEVLFDPIPPAELETYLDTDEPYDKAGAYAIQGFASLWISGIRGDYFGVVGFPVHRFSEMMKRGYGISVAALATQGESK